MLQKFFKKLMGLDKIEEAIKRAEIDLKESYNQLAAAEQVKREADHAATESIKQEELAKLNPKERASRKKEPWVGVLDTHINQDNIRNGFFELDWNDEFVLKLKQEGYGADGDKDEEIVDRWFRELCANVVVDGDFGGPVNTGVIDIASVKRTNNK
jgi:hypothetical protein